MGSTEHGMGPTQPEQLDEGPSDQDLVSGYLDGKVGGREVVRRFLAIAELLDFAKVELLRADGSPVVDGEGTRVTAEDYHLVWDTHGLAKPMILNIIKAGKEGRDPDTLAAVKTLVASWLPEQPPTPEG